MTDNYHSGMSGHKDAKIATYTHRLIEGGGFVIYRVMFEVYSFRENHSPIKKWRLFGVPATKWGQRLGMTTSDLTFSVGGIRGLKKHFVEV